MKTKEEIDEFLLKVRNTINTFENAQPRNIDEHLEKEWLKFGDVPTDPDNQHIEEPFLIWEEGTSLTTIWAWFDREHSKGVGYLFDNF